MSAQLCGCDPEAAHICRRHLEEAQNLNALSERMERFNQRLEADVTHTPTYAALKSKPTPLDESLLDAHRLVDQLRGTLTEVAHRAEAVQTAEQANRHALVTAYAQVAEFQRDIRRIGSALATFYRAPLSMSSVQPLLTLAEELNPELRNDPRRI